MVAIVAPNGYFAEDSMRQIADIHTNMEDLQTDMKYLKDIYTVLNDIKTSLLSAAIGRDQVPKETVESLFDKYESSSKTVFKILGGVIGVLIFIIGALLVGEKLEWIRSLLG